MPITTIIVSSNIAQARCTRYNTMWSNLSVTFGRSVIFVRYSPNVKDKLMVKTMYLLQLLITSIFSANLIMMTRYDNVTLIPIVLHLRSTSGMRVTLSYLNDDMILWGYRTSLLCRILYEMSERLLFNANAAMCQPYHGENKLIINEMMMMRYTWY